MFEVKCKKDSLVVRFTNGEGHVEVNTPSSNRLFTVVLSSEELWKVEHV